MAAGAASPAAPAHRAGTTARVAVAGATGLIGRALLTQIAAERAGASASVSASASAASAAPPATTGPRQPAALYAVVRAARPGGTPAAWPAGVQALPVDFARLGQHSAPALPPLDLALCALGTTIKVAGSQAAFRAVDLDAVLAFARAAQAAGAQGLGVVSALGADARSSVFYNQVKGEAEAALIALGLPRLVIARPSLLLGERHSLGQPTRPGELLAQKLTPAIGWLVPARWRPIQAQVVARALWRALQAEGPAVQVLESDALQRLGAAG